MADNSNGAIYGVAEVNFGGKTLGYISEDGIQPAGEAPSFQAIYAAQKLDGPFVTLMTNPGTEAFTMNLIQLKAQNLADTVGGTANGDGSWTPPASPVVEGGPMDFKTHSGHTMRYYKVRLSRNGFQNGLNMSNLLAYGLRVDVLPPDSGPSYKIFPPGVNPDQEPSGGGQGESIGKGGSGGAK